MEPLFAALAVAGALALPVAAVAAPLPDDRTKTHGTVSCFDGPGNDQAGVAETTQTQGNTSNKSPEEQQNLQDSCKPPKSQGAPCPRTGPSAPGR